LIVKDIAQTVFLHCSFLLHKYDCTIDQEL